MRCLRCALDYGPDVRFCDRCGRTLSRPPGQEPEPGAGMDAAYDLSSLYSTFAPPADEASAATGAISRRAREFFAPRGKPGTTMLAEVGDAAPPAAEPPRETWTATARRALPDYAAIAAPPTAPDESMPRASDSWGDVVDLAGDLPRWDDAAPLPAVPDPLSDEQRDAPAAAGDVLDDPDATAPPFAPEAEPVAEHADPPAQPTATRRYHGGLEDDLDDLSDGSRGKPQTIGSDLLKQTQSGRLRVFAQARQRTPSRRLPRLPRVARVAIPLLVLAAVLGILAAGRYATYSHDLRAARILAGQQQYGAALAHYQQAIGEWPLHSAATREQAAVAATATAITARRAALAAQQQQATAAMAAQTDVYRAWLRMHQQSSQQAH